MNTNPHNEMIDSLRREGLTENEARQLIHDIDQNERWLEQVAPPQADPDVLRRVQETVAKQLAAKKRFPARLFASAAIAAMLLIALGLSLTLKTTPTVTPHNEPVAATTTVTAPSTSEFDILLEESADTEYTVLNESEQIGVDDNNLTELILLYEDIFDQNENWFGKEKNHENQNVNAYHHVASRA